MDRAAGGRRGRHTKAALRSAAVLGGLICAPALAQTPPPAAAPVSAGQPNADLIAKGKYLATAGDCAACHTANGGKEFAGGGYLNTPFGPISVPNITPDPATGIGGWTDDQFVRLFRHGIGKGGEYIYPVMPYPWYTKVTRDDILAIKAYLFSIPPVNAKRPPSHLAFPFNVRAGLAAWQTAFLKVGPFKPDPGKSAQLNRGEYLVQGLGHCGECHNGNNLMGDTEAAAFLQGGPIDKWYAPNITSDIHQGIGRFSNEQLFTYLKTGTAQGMGIAAGPMAQTVHESLSKLSDGDLQAIVAYLKSTPPKQTYQAVHDANYTSGASSAGSEVYLSNCASCHQVDGKGVPGAVPSLVNDGAVTAGGPQTVIRVILGGIEAQGSYAPMPGLGVSLNDQQIAEVTNYVRQSWGNAAPANAGAGEVGAARKETHTLLNGTRPGGCPTIAQGELAKVIADPANGIGDTLKGTTLENMLPNVDQILAKVKAAAPEAKQADIVNSLTIAYCPVVEQDAKLPQQQRTVQLDQFAERVYTQLADQSKN